MPAIKPGSMLVRLAIDYENTSRRWWESGGQALWESLVEGFDGGQVVLEDSLARSWLARAAEIPGWDDGHAYAPHPIALRPVDPDEDV